MDSSEVPSRSPEPPANSPYRRKLDYAVLAILVLVFVWAVARRAWRAASVDEVVVVRPTETPATAETDAPVASEGKARLASTPGAGDARPRRRQRRREDDRVRSHSVFPPEGMVTARSQPPPEPDPILPTKPPPKPDRPATPLRINPNTAKWWELDELPGIGEVKARAIVAYREEHQNAARAAHPGVPPPPAFSKPEDLAQVKGIGPATVEKMRPMLTFDQPRRPPPSSRSKDKPIKPSRRRRGD